MKKMMLLISVTVLLILVVIWTNQSPWRKEKADGPSVGFDIHVDAKHYVKEMRTPVHHWCKTINPDLIECLLFDSDKADAKLVGIETIVTKKVWENFDDAQKNEWHDHATEIIEAETTLPDMPSEKAAQLVEFLKGTRGRIVYIWNFLKESYPVTRPFLDTERSGGEQ